MAFTRRGIHTVLTGQVTGTLTDRVVIVYVVNNDYKQAGSGGYVANANGYDIRFFSDYNLTASIFFDLLYYDSATGTIMFAILASSIADGTIFYSGFGDAALNTNASSTSTWPTRYKGVWPLNTPGGTLSIADRTANANNGTVNNGVAATTGNIDGAGEFVRAAGDYITAPDSTSLDMGTGQTAVSAWIKRRSIGIFGGLISKLDGADVTGYNFVTTNANSWVFICYNSSVPDLVVSSTAPTSTTLWYFVLGFRDGSNLKLYENAVDVTTGTVTDNHRNVDNSQVLAFAPYRSGSLAANLIDADMRDMRVYNVAPTAAEISMEYKNISAPTSFMSYASDAVITPGIGAHFVRSRGGILLFNTSGSAGGSFGGF